MALFGDASFIPIRLANPNGYPYNLSESVKADATPRCTEQIPLGLFLMDEQTGVEINNGVCTESGDPMEITSTPHGQIAQYLQIFNVDPNSLRKAFEAAVFLANKAWIESLDFDCRYLIVNFDPGLDTNVPVMSMASLVLITIFFGLHLLILICLTTWSSLNERWTANLDSWAMMRIGGAIAESIPLKIAENTDKMDFLDEIPGWIGDQADANELVGMIGLGARGPLEDNRRYACYDEDHEDKGPRDEIAESRAKCRRSISEISG
jgi:hypothetical protein